MDLLLSKEFRSNAMSTYKSFDVCYDSEKLVALVTDLLLDSQFYAANKSIDVGIRTWDYQYMNQTIVWTEIINFYQIKADRSTMIVRIVTHIPVDMLQMLLDMVSLESFPITKHSSLVRSTERMNRRTNFYNMEDNSSDIENYLRLRKWKDIIVIHSKAGDLFTQSFNNTKKMLANIHDICLKTLTMEDEKDSLKLMKNLEAMYNANETKNFILIVVGGGDFNNFNKSASYFNNIFAVSPYSLLADSLPFKYKMRFHNLFRYAETIILQQNRNLSAFHNNIAALEVLKYSTYIDIVSLFIATTTEYRWSDLVVKVNEYFLGQLFLPAGPKDEIPNNIVSKCYHPACQPGYEKVYSKVPNKTTRWDEEIGYHCQPCKVNYIKPSYGDALCQPCLDYFESNPQKTKCIDPLLSVYHKPGDVSGIITICLCSVGGVMCFITIAIFIKHRETPNVKTSDFTMSLVHLTAVLLFFCNAAVLFFIAPTSKVCMGRTSSIALLYNLNISIMYTKSSKLVKAFSANIRSTKTEVLKTTLVQAFNITMNLSSAFLLLIALWSHQYPGVAVRLDTNEAKKFLYCNNRHDNIALSGLMLIYHLACFIQAFRCRKLPEHISETMSIVYASFITTVSLCVMFPIIFFQKYEENSELAFVLVLSGNNMILFMFTYAKKLFIIMFRPQKNTKAYFRRKQMEMIEANARTI